jgi:hypothetical protein
MPAMPPPTTKTSRFTSKFSFWVSNHPSLFHVFQKKRKVKTPANSAKSVFCRPWLRWIRYLGHLGMIVGAPISRASRDFGLCPSCWCVADAVSGRNARQTSSREYINLYYNKHQGFFVRRSGQSHLVSQNTPIKGWEAPLASTVPRTTAQGTKDRLSIKGVFSCVSIRSEGILLRRTRGIFFYGNAL